MATSPSPFIPAGWGSPSGGAPAITPSGGAPDISNCGSYGGLEGHEETNKLGSGLLAFVCSLICVILMVADAFRSRIRWKKSWIGCKFFPFNATTLGLLDYATLVSVETLKPMPGLLDQLAKVTGVVFICISMNHAAPSLSTMDGIAIITNLFALGLTVAITFYKVWNQCRTGLVTKFENELTVIRIVMIIIYAFLVSHGLIVPATKKRLESQFDFKHKEIVRGMQNDSSTANPPKFTIEKLKMYIQKYWLMALTCSPEYSLRASIEFQSVPLLTVALCSFFLTSLYYLPQLRQPKCWCRSDYRCSTVAIFFVQVTGIILGLGVALFRSSISLNCCCNIWETAKKYRRHVMQTPRDLMDQAPSFDNAIVMSLLYPGKRLGGALLMGIHGILVLTSWLVILVNVIPGILVTLVLALLLTPLSLLCNWLRCNNNIDDNQEEEAMAPTRDEEDDLQEYVLNLDWVDLDRQSVVWKWKDKPEEWFQKGKGKPPAELKSVLEHLPSSPPESSRFGQHFLGSFQTVVSSDKILKNCWSLHLMTIACIIKALFHEQHSGREMEKLMRGAYEGFRYAKLVDENVTKPSDKTLSAAGKVMETLRYRSKWVDRRSLATTICMGSPKARIDDLKKQSSDILRKYEDHHKSPSGLPLEAIAAKSMKVITTALLEEFDDDEECWSFEFHHLKEALRIVLAECLTKLPEAIFHQCSRGSFGSRESAVRLAAEVLGETEEILNYLEIRQRGSVQL